MAGKHDSVLATVLSWKRKATLFRSQGSMDSQSSCIQNLTRPETT